MIIKIISRATNTQVKQLLNAPSTRFIQSLLQSRISHAALAIAIAVVVSAAFGETFYAQPQLKVGDTAPQTISAPSAGRVEDIAATALKRQEARQVLPVFILDATQSGSSKQNLTKLLEKGQALRDRLGSFPIVSTQVISSNVQTAIRRASAEEWDNVIKGLQNQVPDTSLTNWQQQAILQIQRRRKAMAGKPASLNLKQLLADLGQARQNYQTTVESLNQAMPDSDKLPQAQALLELSNNDWQQLQQVLPPLADRILAQGLSAGLPHKTKERAFLMQAELILPQPTQALAVEILLQSLEPNVVADLDQTQQIADAAVRSVEPVMISVGANDVITTAGTPITPKQALLLEHFKLDQRTINWRNFLRFTLWVSGGLAVFYLLAQRLYNNIRQSDYGLILLLALTTALLILVGVPSINLPMLGLLLGSFYNPLLAILTIVSISSILPIGLGVSIKPLLASLAGGILASGYAARLRSREDSVLLGIIVGATQGVLYFVIGWMTQMSWAELAKWTAVYGLLGLAWCIVAIGISPYLERTFDLVTTIRLVELANLNRPLLKRLAAETPGTFQHTLAVANLAEAAGKELGCNVELIRTGTLYHDIGKMHDPLGFIENQMGRENKHDTIDDPWVSATIIRKHVTEGIVMARKAGLPRAVRAFIPEHQGAQLISYFHHKALQKQSDNSDITVDAADFRYAGPNPQSRETGIVMLADCCEAALRSIKDANPEIAANMIQKIFRARWKEGALSASGLSRRDLDRIAETFLQVWQQSNHQRIAYPQ